MTRRTRRTTRRTLIRAAALLAVLASLSAYAYTATNTVSGTRRLGSGLGTISGFAISNVEYRSPPNDPLRIQRVDFDLSPAATSVMAKLVSTSNVYRACNLQSGGTHARCIWPGAQMPTRAQADVLRVIAVR